MDWMTVEHPGYFGKKRDDIYKLWDETHGRGSWRIMHQWGRQAITENEALKIYEDGYYEFLKKNPEIVDWLTKEAKDVYDTEPSNVNCGLDYNKQDSGPNHYQDISVRWAVLRLGKEFRGDRLIQVRSGDSEGKILSPGVVPFHLPEMIEKVDIKSYSNKKQWWNNDSIEDFWQKNKILQVRAIYQ